MDKYVVISDPIRSKEFALVGELNGSIIFKPFNEIAKKWSHENSSVKSLNFLNIPDGMHVSTPKRMTTSISLLFDAYENEESAKIKDTAISAKSNNEFLGRKLNNHNEKTSISNIEIRKISLSSKLNLIDYKAHLFINRSKKSSVISAVRSGSLKLDKKTASFFSKSNPSIDSLSKTAGSSFVRRIAVSHFVTKSCNRLNRRSNSLSSMSADELQKSNNTSPIDIAISSKAKRFK